MWFLCGLIAIENQITLFLLALLIVQEIRVLLMRQAEVFAETINTAELPASTGLTRASRPRHGRRLAHGVQSAVE